MSRGYSRFGFNGVLDTIQDAENGVQSQIDQAKQAAIDKAQQAANDALQHATGGSGYGTGPAHGGSSGSNQSTSSISVGKIVGIATPLALGLLWWKRR